MLAMLSNSSVHPELGVQDVTEAENYEALLRHQFNFSKDYSNIAKTNFFFVIAIISRSDEIEKERFSSLSLSVSLSRWSKRTKICV